MESEHEKKSEKKPKTASPNHCKTSGADAAIAVADEKMSLEESTSGENCFGAWKYTQPLNRQKMHPVEQ